MKSYDYAHRQGLLALGWEDFAALARQLAEMFVIFPWDRRVLIGGQWLPHPEILAGLKLQGYSESNLGT